MNAMRLAVWPTSRTAAVQATVSSSAMATQGKAERLALPARWR